MWDVGGGLGRGIECTRTVVEWVGGKGVEGRRMCEEMQMLEKIC